MQSFDSLPIFNNKCKINKYYLKNNGGLIKNGQSGQNGGLIKNGQSGHSIKII